MSAVIDRSAAVARDLNNDRAFEAWLEDDKCMKWLDERGDEAPEAQKARAAALHVTSRGAFSMDQCERMATEEEFRRLAAEDIELPWTGWLLAAAIAVVVLLATATREGSLWPF